MERRNSESIQEKGSVYDVRNSPYNFNGKSINPTEGLCSTKCLDAENPKSEAAESVTPVLCGSLGGIKIFNVSSASVFTGLNILKPLGKGSFAKVWLVQDPKNGQQLAAKLLQPQAFPNPDVVSKLVAKEIANLAASQCLGVVKFHRMVVGKEGILLLQEHATAGNLWQHKVSDVFGVFIQIVQALLYLRDVQVVHRDLKPTNIFMCSNGRLVIGDFGWSEMLQNMNGSNSRSYVNNDNLRYYDEVTRIMEKYLKIRVRCTDSKDGKGQECPGTFEINPPEILLNCGPFNEKIDIYALGMIFLMLLTGRFICRPKNKEVNAIIKGLMNTLKSLRTPQPHRSFKVSKAAWNLFLGLTEPDANSRFSLEDILNHPWTRNKFSYFCPNKWSIWHPKVRFAWINAVPTLPMNVPTNKADDVTTDGYKGVEIPRIDTARVDVPRIDTSRVDTARVESGRIDSSRVDSARSISSSASVDTCTSVDYGRGVFNKSMRSYSRYANEIGTVLEGKYVPDGKVLEGRFMSEGKDYVSISDYKNLRGLPDSGTEDLPRNKNRVVDSAKFAELESCITKPCERVTNPDVKVVNRHVYLTSRISTHILQDDKSHVSAYHTPSIQSINQPMPLKENLDLKSLKNRENTPNFVPF